MHDSPCFHLTAIVHNTHNGEHHLIEKVTKRKPPNKQQSSVVMVNINFCDLNEPKNRKNKTNVNYTRRKSVPTRKDLKIHLARLLFNIL